jgi:transcriptional regulator with XRE-family HTH domain
MSAPVYVPNVFGQLLRSHRQTAGLTLEGLAERSGLTARAVSDIERGRTTRPYPRSMRQLADALRLTGAARDEFLTAPGGIGLQVGPGPAV